MKQHQVNDAYQTLSKLNGTKFPIRVAYNMYQLLKKLEPSYTCEVDLERKLLAKYNGYVSDNGDLVFGSDDEPLEVRKQYRADFLSEVNELCNIEVDLDFDPIIIRYDDMEGQTLSITDIAKLDGFVVFE